MIDTYLEAIGLKKAPLILGFLGSVIALKWIEAIGFWGRLSAVFTGCLTAQILTPMALDYFEFQTKYEGGISFVIGLFSMSVLGAIIKAINNADLWSLIKERLSNK